MSSMWLKINFKPGTDDLNLEYSFFSTSFLTKVKEAYYLPITLEIHLFVRYYSFFLFSFYFSRLSKTS